MDFVTASIMQIPPTGRSRRKSLLSFPPLERLFCPSFDSEQSTVNPTIDRKRPLWRKMKKGEASCRSSNRRANNGRHIARRLKRSIERLVLSLHDTQWREAAIPRPSAAAGRPWIGVCNIGDLEGAE